MLDQADGQAVAVERDEVLGDLVGQARIDAGHRLVEQEHLRLGHQGTADLDELLLTAGKRRDGIVEHVVELQPPRDLEGALGQFGLAPACRSQ